MKDLFSPSVMVSGSWCIILLLYVFYPHGLYPISNQLYLLLMYWASLFSVCSLLTGMVNVPLPRITRISIKEYRFSRKIFYLLIFLNLLLIIMLIRRVDGGTISDLRMMSLEEELPITIKLLYYVNQFSIVYSFGLVYFMRKKHIKYTFSFIIILLISLIYKTNKTGFIIFFIGILYVIKKIGALNIRNILIALGCFIGLMIITVVTRGDSDSSTFNWMDYLTIYLLSPLPAFDMILNHELPFQYGNWGSNIFRFFYTVLETLGLEYQKTNCGGWVNVPVPTNVYTVLQPFYLDFGIIGILLFACFLGGLWGTIYKLQRKGYLVYILFYASMIYSLAVQFFSDYFFGFLSVTIQNFLYSIIVVCIFTYNIGFRFKRYGCNFIIK